MHVSIKSWFDSKNKIIFAILITFLTVSLIIGITLTSSGANDYYTFIKEWKSVNSGSATISHFKDITMFIYSVFFLAMSILMIIASILFGNSTFNKKINNEEN